MTDTLLALAADLERRGEPFALATVVRCEAPTSAKPGAKALVRADGTVTGWVGGACAEPVVVREALGALSDGRPRLIGLLGEGRRDPGRAEGLLAYPMTCHSGGTLEIYVEAYLPKPRLLVVGHGPVVESLAALGRSADYSVVVLDAEALDQMDAAMAPRRTSVVVATHGDADEEAVARALASESAHVSLVASRRRAAVIVEALRRRGVPADRLGRLKAPAGLDLGAVTPAEIAVSILADLIQHHRGAKMEAGEPAMAAAEAIDPICGMVVDVASARYRTERDGQVVYFCCLHCKETFEARPA